MGANWEAMGFPRWPMSFCLVVVVLLGIWSALRLFRSGASPELRTKAWLDGIPVWGFLAFLGGILHDDTRIRRPALVPATAPLAAPASFPGGG